MSTGATITTSLEQRGGHEYPNKKVMMSDHWIIKLWLILLCLSSPLQAKETEETKPWLNWRTFEEADLLGYQSQSGKTIIAPRFTMAEPFSQHGTAFVVKDGTWVLIQFQGKVLLQPFIFDNGPDPFQQGVARFVEHGKVGFFNRAGEKTIAAQFDFAWPFTEEGAVICQGCRKVQQGEHWQVMGGKHGQIDQQGNLTKPLTTWPEDQSYQGYDTFAQPDHAPCLTLNAKNQQHQPIPTSWLTTHLTNCIDERVHVYDLTTPKMIHQHPLLAAPEGMGADKQTVFSLGSIQVNLISKETIHCKNTIWAEGFLQYIDLGGQEKTKNSYQGWALQVYDFGCS